MPTSLDEALFTGLVDDAAVFPPGLAPLPRAVADHVGRTAYRRFVGPLLVPAAAADEVVALAAGRSLRLGLIARPSMPLGPVLEGAATLAGTSVQLAGVEVGAASDWPALLDLGVPVTVEIPRDGRDEALDAVTEAAGRSSGDDGKALVQAKFRTGATETWAWPDEAELAAFLAACVERRLAFKLTGGLHHVVRADHPGPAGGPQHGLLNVLAALAAVLDGASTHAAATVLAVRHTDPIVAALAALTPPQTSRLRGHFTAYGCCDVLDPLRELADLDLITKEH